MIGAYIFLFVFVAALAGAFVAQWILPPIRRTRIILTAAAAPPTLLIVATLIGSLFFLDVGVDISWFQAVVSLALSFFALTFVGLVGAIVGSELASLSRWLLRRQD